MASTPNTTGTLLRRTRERRGLTRDDLARDPAVDVTTDLLARMERADYPVAALPKLRARVWRYLGLLVQPVDAPGEWHDARTLVSTVDGPALVAPKRIA